MYVVNDTVSIVVTCDTCGDDWEGTRTEPKILTHDEATGEPWRESWRNGE